MPLIHRSRAALRISGDELLPEEISAILGACPTRSHRKGEVQRTCTGHEVKKKTSMWILKAKKHEPANLDDQVSEILGKLTQNINEWNSLSQRFQIDLFCGLFMEASNEGLTLLPATLLALAERKIELNLDIYYINEGEISDEAMCPCGSGNKYGQCCAPKPSAEIN